MVKKEANKHIDALHVIIVGRLLAIIKKTILRLTIRGFLAAELFLRFV